MRKLIPLGSLGLVLVLALTYLKRETHPLPLDFALLSRPKDSKVKNLPVQATGGPSDTPATDQNPPTESMNQHFARIVGQMKGLTENPEAADQEISRLAESLSDAQLKELTTLVLSRHKSGDEKLLATELLARSPNANSIDSLNEIILTPPQDISKNPSIQEEQRAFQMLAIEGIANKTDFKDLAKKDLAQLLPKINDTALGDRIHRSLWALEGKAPTPEEQDRAALEQLLRHQ